MVEGQRVTSNPAFYVELDLDHVPHGTAPTSLQQVARLTVGLVSWADLQGSYVETTCMLHPAIAEYHVVIENNTIAFAEDADQGQIVRLAHNAPSVSLEAPSERQYDTLDEITRWLSIFVNANASVGLIAGGGPFDTYSMNSLTLNPLVARHLNFFQGARAATKDLNFVDPTPVIISKFNQLMFRGAIYAVSPGHDPNNWPQESISELLDPGVSIHQAVTANQTLRQIVFHSDLRWYAGAAVFEIATVLLILPMFWGWWTLGTNLTLSPIDVALAFDSPILKTVNSAVGAKGVVRQLGELKLKFGSVNPTDDAADKGSLESLANGRLGDAEAGKVYGPQRGVRFHK